MWLNFIDFEGMLMRKQLRKLTILTIILILCTLIFSACETAKTSVDLREDFRFAMGNSDVPVGTYTQKIFDYYEINVEDVKGCIDYCSNVKEVTTAIAEGTVDCGVVYETDAHSANLTIVDTATDEMCGRVLYPAAILKDSKNKSAAEHFMQYLQTQNAAKIFENVGFTPLVSKTEKLDASQDSGEVIVFAAASLTETLTAIAEEYKTVAPNVSLVFSFDSSGTLKTQIEEGANCDIFISAAQKQMNELDIACDQKSNPERLDFVDADSRIDLLENKVLLCVSENSNYKIDGFETLMSLIKEK